MAEKRYIQVILPLRLEWEPVYSIDFDEIGTGSTGRDGDRTDIGSRVRVPFAGKEYVAVVSHSDASGTAAQLSPGRIKAVTAKEPGLERISLQEIALWRKVAEYYLCTVGEVYKAAYPAGRIAREEALARSETLRSLRERKILQSLETRVLKLEERLHKMEKRVAKSRKEETRIRYSQERDKIAQELATRRIEYLELETASPADRPFEIRPENEQAAIVLSAGQQEACRQITRIFKDGKPALLHGVTGSGKTEIYLELARETLRQGRNVLFLVPEIALSRQLEERISALFSNRLFVFHSAESPGGKRKTADAIRQGSGYVILGTRSALFLPHTNLGLVIVDEEHDASYKQESPAPRYHARETAIMLAGIFHAPVILGSATPSLESLYNCQVGRFGLVTLNKRYYETADAEIEVIDTIAERRKNGMVGHFSRKLIAHMTDCLAENRQIAVLRERRAYSPIVQCRECGAIPKCSRCNVSLSLHKRGDSGEKLVCHYCGRTYEYTGTCTRCGGRLIPAGAGTQKIEEEARELFPAARIVRLDSDATHQGLSGKQAIRDFAESRTDILIGTQIVAKGFDFSGLKLVAVLQADSIIGQQDFRADEKSLQLLEQFRGRCGRRNERGRFVIQTSQPDHPVYQCLRGEVSGTDTRTRLLAERRTFGYPPYSRVIGVIIKDRNEPRIELMGHALFRMLAGDALSTGATVTGPYAPPVDKVSGQYIRHIRILLKKDRNLAANKSAIARTTARFEKEKKYGGHISLDVDPA